MRINGLPFVHPAHLWWRVRMYLFCIHRGTRKRSIERLSDYVAVTIAPGLTFGFPFLVPTTLTLRPAQSSSIVATVRRQKIKQPIREPIEIQKHQMEVRALQPR